MEQTVDSGIDQRVRKTLARVFHLSAAEVGEDLRMGYSPLWDSMGHMQLLVELEKEFSLTFPTYEIAELLSTEAIIKTVEKYLQNRLPA